MTGVCVTCGAAFETAEEHACTPGIVCPTCHWAPRAVELVDQFGPWASPGWQWWIDAGYPNPTALPLRGLVAAVKIESFRRKLAADPQPGGVAFFHFT